MKKSTEFQISQLRQDKIIYAVEAIAVGITVLVSSSLISLIANFGIVPDIYLFYTSIAIFIYSIGFTLYALIGNLIRLKKIKKLEKSYET